MSLPKRVVVTGMGVVSPLGISVDSTWEALKLKLCAIKRNNFESSKISAFVDFGDTQPFDHIPRFAKMALLAAEQAVCQAKLHTFPAFRSAVAVGSGFGEIRSIENSCAKLKERKNARLSPYMIPCGLIDSAAVQISLKYGLKGPCMALSAACATGSENIGAAFSLIQNGKADIALCGASESTDNVAYIHAGFSACRALAKNHNTAPEKSSRPFDKDRNGFVLSEGAAILVLENRDTAAERGAGILAELVGHGSTCDAYHLTSPCPNGDGAFEAMKSALQSAGVQRDDVDFIIAHASSTVSGDRSENKAIKAFFKGLKKKAVCAFKGSYGHTLAASGAIDACMGIKAMSENHLPGIRNLENLEDGFDLDYVIEGRNANVSCFMVNSFGFGGHNSCLVFKKSEDVNE